MMGMPFVHVSALRLLANLSPRLHRDVAVEKMVDLIRELLTCAVLVDAVSQELAQSLRKRDAC